VQYQLAALDVKFGVFELSVKFSPNESFWDRKFNFIGVKTVNANPKTQGS
jgi:hypothetical protein